MKEVGSLIGKILLIGITLLDDEESLLEQIQVYGPIEKIDANGIVIRRNQSGSKFSIPADFEHVSKADPGEYRLRSTGEIVIDPDFLSSWTVRSANKESIEKYREFGFSGYEKNEL